MSITLAVVVPVYSGEAYLDDLVAEVAKLRDSWASEQAPTTLSRLVLVNDGAIDSSPAIVAALSERFSWVEGVHLSRNFGQHPATVAGILHTEEDWVVTMDEDLQHPPSRIPQLLCEAVLNSYDVVYGRPDGQIHEAMSRDLTSRAYKRLIEWLTGSKHIRLANSFRLVRGEIARDAARVCAHDAYLDVVLSWYTQRVAAVTMPLKDIRFITTRKSGYRVRSLVSHGRRLILSSQIKVLRLGALFGVAIAGLSGLVAVLVFLLGLFDPSTIQARGWTSLMLATTFLGGVILVMIGIALEYIAILLSRSNGRPLFFEVDRRGDVVLADYFKTQPAPGIPKASLLQSSGAE